MNPVVKTAVSLHLGKTSLLGLYQDLPLNFPQNLP
jgi:hypothetical protein